MEGFWQRMKEVMGAGRCFANLQQLYERTRQVLMAHQERPMYACSWERISPRILWMLLAHALLATSHGSPRALTLLICKTPRYCLVNCPELCVICLTVWDIFIPTGDDWLYTVFTQEVLCPMRRIRAYMLAPRKGAQGIQHA
jgi:hypothetical protein